MVDLIAELRREPTEDERALAEGVGLSTGHPVPFHMFAKVAMQDDRQEARIGAIEGTRKWFRRRARAALIAMAAGWMPAAGYAVHRIKAAGAEEEREAQQARDILRLEQDVRDLRKICGLDAQPMSIVQLGP